MAPSSPWRTFCALAALGIVLQLAILTSSGEPRLIASEIAGGDTLPLMLVGFAACIAAIVHARGGWRDAGALGLALVAGVAGGTYATQVATSGLQLDRLIFGRVSWKSMAVLGLALPPALLFARGARRAAFLALAGAALALVGIALASPRAVAFDNARALPAIALFATGAAIVAIALAREAWAPHPRPARPLPAWGFAGAFVLALAWGFGGSFLIVVPLWILAPILLAMPALTRWRVRPTAALASGALLFAGALVPLGSCSFPNISDVVVPGEPRAALETVRLWEVAGHGPFWVRSDLMGAGPVVCSTLANLVGAAWLGALVAVAWLRWPEPDALVRRIARTPEPPRA